MPRSLDESEAHPEVESERIKAVCLSPDPLPFVSLEASSSGQDEQQKSFNLINDEKDYPD